MAFTKDKKNEITQETITSKLIKSLRTDILSGVIPAGTHIGVKDISERYGISNMPVREAFFTLSAEKLIEMSPYKGATVLPVNESFIVDNYEILEMLEYLLARTAMPYINSDDISRLKEINRRIWTLEDSRFGQEEYTRLNHMLHNIIYCKSPNDHAYERYNYYHEMVMVLWTNYNRMYKRMQQAAAEHDDIIAALENRDEQALENAVRLHSTHAKDNYMAQRDALAKAKAAAAKEA